MGNSIVTSQLHENDLDKYLNEISPSFVCQDATKNRFLKTLKCISEEGFVIVKLYIKQNTTSLKEIYEQEFIGM